ncbi:MAG: 4-(cytidine 5'-diphospho)-2-C-methyl-D-erythritol kinase [Rikenellaceae bacterium]|nr:4-(cytidine 5'-diphospho)-2-C-methyl-D-erythritol kinase [Rikenellaceae bacterium]
MILFPNCKINLGLNVISRRNDGYHNIETCMVPVRGLTDALEIVRSEKEGIEFTASGKVVDCPPEKNICVKAYNLVREKYEIDGVRMHLHKNIPFGAGLGGGSSDAVAVIKLLNDLFCLAMCPVSMRKLALMLGSDTVFFVENEPAICYGRGEITERIELDLAGYYLALVKPDVSVSTADAYSHIVLKGANLPLGEVLKTDIENWKDNVKNDFEEYVFAKYPGLSDIKAKMYEYGAVYASMSGSGSAIYGIFRQKPEDLRFINVENYIFEL